MDAWNPTAGHPHLVALRRTFVAPVRPGSPDGPMTQTLNVSSSSRNPSLQTPWTPTPKALQTLSSGTQTLITPLGCSCRGCRSLSQAPCTESP